MKIAGSWWGLKVIAMAEVMSGVWPGIREAFEACWRSRWINEGEAPCAVRPYCTVGFMFVGKSLEACFVCLPMMPSRFVRPCPLLSRCC